MRGLVLLALGLCATQAFGQDAPRLTVDMAETGTLVGQPLILQIDILVPTWLPKPPDFPSLEVPGVMVRLPERASQPISERVDGATWSGVSRRYRLYPLRPGQFDIPNQTVGVTYAKPGADPISVDLTLPAIAFNATVPEAARGLAAPIIAQDFTLEATVEGDTDLEIGGAVVRTVTAKIDGTTPVLIPVLTPDLGNPVLRSYPDEPKVTETEARGTLSGARQERTTYLAQAEGQVALPAIAIDWYDLDSGTVQTASVPAVPLSIAPAPEAPRSLRDLPWQTLLAGLAALVLVAVALRAVWPRLNAWWCAGQHRWLTSERYAHGQVMAAIRKRDLSKLYTALERWRRFHPTADVSEMEAALVTLGTKRFADISKGRSQGAWSQFRATYRRTRHTAQKADADRRTTADLPPLNPH